MQRLNDIIADDLNYIMTVYRDFTEEITIQCGAIKKSVYGSLQVENNEFAADTTATNPFSCWLYYIEPNDSDFNRAMVTNAIIIVNSKSYKIIDSTVVKGLRVLSLEKHGGR